VCVCGREREREDAESVKELQSLNGGGVVKMALHFVVMMLPH